MPTTEIPAVLLQRPGVDWERQYAACRPYVERHRYVIVSITDDPDAALAMLEAGEALVIVAAIDLPGDHELERLACGAGGRLEYCRPPRHRPEPAVDGATGEIVNRMARNGGTPAEISRLLGLTLERVREILRRHR